MKSIKVFFLFLSFLPLSYAQKEILVTDMLKIKSCSNLSFSPDGNKITYTVTSIEPNEKEKGEFNYLNQIWLADLKSMDPPRQITFNPAGATSPVWSPEGNSIAFTRSVDTKSQIFILPLTGGEAWQLTDSKNGANNPKWSPDGTSIIYSSNITVQDLINDTILNPSKSLPAWPIEKAGLINYKTSIPRSIKPNADGTLEEVRAYLLQDEKDKKAKVFTKLQFQQETATSNDMLLNHLYIISAKKGSKAKALSSGFYSYTNPQFIPGTSLLMVETDQDISEHPDRSLESEIYTLNLENGLVNKILAKNKIAYNNASLSPSGKWLAFTQSPSATVTIPVLCLLKNGGSEKDIKTIKYDRNIGNIQWSADESTLYFISPSNGGSVLNKLNIGSLTVETLSSFNEGISNLDISVDRIAYVKTEIGSPFEIYTADLQGKNSKKITGLNTDWIAQKKLSIPEKFSFKNEKGQSIEYWVMKPSNFESGKKFPVILDIHGGPTAMWGPGEASMWHEFQYYCGKGYGVVYCNPRGSGGYGLDFMKANINDWGTGPASDVLKSLDGAVSQGWIDTARMAVTGGSYAGYLVAWIISHDQRFKAACSQRGVYDLRTFFGEGNAWRLVPNYFGGYPWNPESMKILDRESPINYVQNIHTPFIIFHGENDLRTGVIQSEQMYKSLKVLGRTVEYVRHPGASHEITRSGNNRQRIDQMLRTWEFFERFIKH